jgi:ABC-2 type transport system permease protein
MVFARAPTLAGWTLGETIALLGAFTAVGGLLETFVGPNLDLFAARVQRGELDDVLLQPAPSLFLASQGTARPWALAQVPLGLAVMAAGLLRTGTALTIAGVLAGLARLAGGAVIAWARRVLLASLAFWAPGLDLSVAFSGFWQLGRYPVAVYTGPIRWALTYAVPVALVTTAPVHALTHGPDPALIAQGLVAISGLIVVVNVVWRAGLRRCTGATS